jgi:hypothetical protein
MPSSLHSRSTQSKNSHRPVRHRFPKQHPNNTAERGIRSAGNKLHIVMNTLNHGMVWEALSWADVSALLPVSPRHKSIMQNPSLMDAVPVARLTSHLVGVQRYSTLLHWRILSYEQNHITLRNGMSWATPFTQGNFLTGLGHLLLSDNTNWALLQLSPLSRVRKHKVVFDWSDCRLIN